MFHFSKTWSKLLNAIAAELSLFDNSVLNLIKESVPGLSLDLLTDWERMLGLPDVCSKLATTVPERQAVAHAKYTTRYSGLSAEFFERYAESIGSTIKVIESFGGGEPFRVDFARVDRTTENGVDGARLWSMGIYHEWAIEISSTDPNKAFLQCYFDKIKPAHTLLYWMEV
jgi:uncharacterized protein YmfQ (DUF2313 family)